MFKKYDFFPLVFFIGFQSPVVQSKILSHALISLFVEQVGSQNAELNLFCLDGSSAPSVLKRKIVEYIKR